MSNDHYLDPYKKSVRKHGSDFGVTLWANTDSQERRFEVLTQMCFLADKRILDAGCSRGDLAAYLAKRDIPFQSYVGVDALCDVIDFAAKRGLPRSQFRCGDFVADPSILAIGDPQIIFISGSLNTMTDDQAVAVLESAWAATSEALIFNFLSDRAAPQAPLQKDTARRLDTFKLLDWALAKTWAVALRHDYFNHGHDATILMRKIN